MSEDRFDRDRGWRPTPKQVGGGVIVLLAVIFVLQNTQRVRIHILTGTIDAQLWLVLVVMFAVGAVAATLLHWRGERRRD